LVLFAALLSTLISATIGTTCLLISGGIKTSAYSSTWLAWWVGDMLGALVVAPVILIWSTKPRINFRPKRFIEALMFTLILVGACVLVFKGSTWFGIRPFSFAYIIFPILTWIALRFGQFGSVSASLTVSLIAIWGTITSFSSSSSDQLSHKLLLIQSFMGISAVTFMTMAAVVSERVLNQKKQQKLEHKAALLTKQRSRLVALNKAKDEFIALASHQLRTPATSVKQYTSMLLDNYAGKLSRGQRKMLKVAIESNERQLQIIDDLLRVAQVDSGSIVLKKEKVNLRLLIKEILEVQNSVFVISNQNIKLMPSAGAFIANVDKEKIRTVIENMLDNANKYSHPYKNIEVRLRKVNSNIVVTIKDEGVGIHRKDMPKLFKKFSRIDNPLSVLVGGNGLGLYWSKKIVDLHNGEITVVSVPNQGSTFTINLPSGV